jgi:hypothetical protein
MAFQILINLVFYYMKKGFWVDVGDILTGRAKPTVATEVDLKIDAGSVAKTAAILGGTVLLVALIIILAKKAM